MSLFYEKERLRIYKLRRLEKLQVIVMMQLSPLSQIERAFSL